MSDISDDMAVRRERISASTQLKQSVIKHLSLEIISRHSFGGNLRYEKIWRGRIGELVHDIMHNAIYFHQLEHPEEPIVDYENKVIPFVQKQFNTYNNFLDSMISRGVCVDGVITSQISKAVDKKLFTVSSMLDKYATTLVSEAAKSAPLVNETTSRRFNFPDNPSFAIPSVKDLVCTKTYSKGRV